MILTSVAAASVALLSTSPVVSGAPVVVTDYKQLVGTVGSNNDYGTGERFVRYTIPQLGNDASPQNPWYGRLVGVWGVLFGHGVGGSRVVCLCRASRDDPLRKQQYSAFCIFCVVSLFWMPSHISPSTNPSCPFVLGSRLM